MAHGFHNAQAIQEAGYDDVSSVARWLQLLSEFVSRIPRDFSLTYLFTIIMQSATHNLSDSLSHVSGIFLLRDDLADMFLVAWVSWEQTRTRLNSRHLRGHRY